MKKALALILMLTLLLTLAACGKKGGEGEPAAAPTPAELWSELGGVWVHTEDDDWHNYFLWFYTSQGECFMCVGLFASDYGEVGRLTSLEKLDDERYLVKLHYDAVPANELNDGRDAYDSDFTLNLAGVTEKTLLYSSENGEGEVAFDLMGATVEEAANAAMPQAEAISPEAFWGDMAGVWVHYDNENAQHSFIQFLVEGGEYIVYDGIIATSFGQKGALQRLDKVGDDLYVLTVHYPEMPAGEMDDARAAFDDSITINTAAMYEKTVMLTSARFPEPAPFDLLGETLEEVSGNPALYA